MINKSQYQKIHTQNLNQNEADRKWRLFEEEQAERKADKAYWEPLKRELEQMRHAKLRAAGN